MVVCVADDCGEGIGAAGTTSNTFSGGASVADDMLDESSLLITSYTPLACGDIYLGWVVAGASGAVALR